jgi:hypothetical protein
MSSNNDAAQVLAHQSGNRQEHDGGSGEQRSQYNDTTNRHDYQELRVNGRVLGEISNGALRKRIYGSRHFMRSPAGIGWDVWALEQAETAGCKITIVTDLETGRVYVAEVADFRTYGVQRNHGYGDQLILPFRYWRSSEALNEQRFPPAIRDEPLQLVLL